MATKVKEPARPAQDMRGILERQRTAFLAELPVGEAVRKDRLMRAKALLLDNRDALARAVSDDFGHRSTEQTMLTDIMASVGPLNHAAKHLGAWMAREKRKLDFPLGLLGAKAWVEYQPKGVVGVVAPWNFPINLTFGPLAGVLAAGNRAMVKPSEFTPATSELLAELAAKYFDAAELAFVTGGPEVGKAFTELPFDHMIFTGATSIGRHVMRAAAENLVPLTLELGGKSPTIVGRSANIAQATDRVATGKMMNAGQICLAPDYMLVPEEQEGEVVEGLKASAARLYPTLLSNPDYTSVVNGRHRERLESYLADAREKGAEIIVVNPANEDFSAQNTHKMPLHIVRKVSDDMKIMQEEIFGPLLPVMTYKKLDEAVDYINRRDRPLGLYYFGEDAGEQRRVLDRTISGGVTVNDVIMHISSEDLPFGGVGPSGMGSYHGHDGFKTFSHAKAVYKQPKLDIAKLAGFKPPYGATTQKTLRQRLK